MIIISNSWESKVSGLATTRVIISFCFMFVAYLTFRVCDENKFRNKMLMR